MKQQPVDTDQAHKFIHMRLHKALDELVADFILHTGLRPSQTTILALMEWSNEQTVSPTPWGEKYTIPGNIRDGKNMMQLPPQNTRVEHWIVGEHFPLTAGQRFNLQLTDVVLETYNGYHVLRYYYVVHEYNSQGWR